MKVNRTEMAHILSVALTTLDAWVREGCPVTRDGRNVIFDTADVVKWTLERERNRAKRDEPAEGEISFAEATRRKAVADALKAELGLQEALANVAPVDLINRIVQEELERAFGPLLAIPAKFKPTATRHASSPERAQRLVEALDDAIREALSEIRVANPASRLA